MSADSRSRVVARTTRRDALLALAGGALAARSLMARTSHAHGRVQRGGRLSLRAPWPLASVDPHRLDDAAALFFGGCLFDSLYALDASGAVSSVLAETLPEVSPEGTYVVLREGVRFASGKPLTARDVVASIARARTLGARGWLDGLGRVRVSAPGVVVVLARNPDHVAKALASPLAAIVPEHFTPERPDGTGPFAFQAHHDEGALSLVQNRYAAQGPSFLDELSISSAPDLAASLRSFESGEDDIAWLGLGLHEPRRGAVPFDAGLLGWAILRTGNDAGRWSAPGVAQRLADGIEPSRLAALGIRDRKTVEVDDGWGGAPAALLVRADSPWLVELAHAVAAALSRPSHEVVARPVSPADFAAARASHAYALAVDLVRPFDRTPLGTCVALATSDDPARGDEMARRPPLGDAALGSRAIGHVLRVGVLAEVHFEGGHMPDLVLPPGTGGVGVDFGSITHPHPRVL